MFVPKYIKIIFVISIMVFISVNIPCLYAQETTESISEKTEPEHEHQHEHEHEQESNKAHEHEHQHEPEEYDPTGENALFGRETHHDHEHQDCEYFHKAWRQLDWIDIMKKYSFTILALFVIIILYRIIATNIKNEEIKEKQLDHE